jgi:hypothetical protein
MKKIILLLSIIGLIACNNSKPETTTVIQHDTVFITVHDTIIVEDINYLDSVFNIRKANINRYADSVFAQRRFEIAKIKTEALQEVELFRQQTINQLEEKKAELLALKKTKVYNNLIIKGDTLHNAEVVFGADSIPKIIFK